MQLYTLKYPLTLKSGEQIADVAIRRMKGKDQRALDKYLVGETVRNPMAMQLEMVERLVVMPDGSDIYPGFADDLDTADLEALGEFVMPTAVGGLPTG